LNPDKIKKDIAFIMRFLADWLFEIVYTTSFD